MLGEAEGVQIKQWVGEKNGGVNKHSRDKQTQREKDKETKTARRYVSEIMNIVDNVVVERSAWSGK